MNPLKPYFIYAKVGVFLAIIGYMGYLQYVTMDQKNTLTENKNKITELETSKATLEEKIKKAEEESKRVSDIDEKTTDVEIQIKTEYVEVTKDVYIYRDNPISKRCVIDSQWVRIYDRAASIVGLPESELASKIQSSARADGENVTLSEEEWNKFSITLDEALGVSTRNLHRCADTYAKYFGLYEICTGEKLAPFNKGE